VLNLRHSARRPPASLHRDLRAAWRASTRWLANALEYGAGGVDWIVNGLAGREMPTPSMSPQNGRHAGGDNDADWIKYVRRRESSATAWIVASMLVLMALRWLARRGLRGLEARGEARAADHPRGRNREPQNVRAAT